MAKKAAAKVTKKAATVPKAKAAAVPKADKALVAARPYLDGSINQPAYVDGSKRG